MKFLDCRLKSINGLYAVLGKEDIKIDFTKCQNSTIAILGPSGCGKSTLMTALNILPLPNSFFIPERNGLQEYTIQNKDILYHIEIKNNCKANNKEKRETKAYIQKIINGQFIEMNPNGNVSSYLEYIYDEFNLDKNYMMLSTLSISSKGIVDLTPSERKRYIATIINDIDVYNGFLKVLSKRRSNIKSIMNNVVNKIDSIGDVNTLTISLKSIENQLDKLKKDKDQMICELGSYKAKLELLDPNGDIQNRYKKIFDDLGILKKSLELNQNEIDKLNINVRESDLQNHHQTIKNQNIELSNKISINESKIESLLQKRESISSSLVQKKASIDSLDYSADFISSKNKIDECNKNIAECKAIIDQIGIKSDISKDEFIIGLNALHDIKETIDIVRSSNDFDIISQVCDLIISNRSIPNIEEVENKIESTKEILNQITIDINKYNILLKETEKLKGRDEKCTITTCSFIKGALEAQAQKPQENLDRLEEQYKYQDNLLNSLNIQKDKLKEMQKQYNYLISINKYLSNNIKIINKLPVNFSIFRDNLCLFKAILDGYDFKEIDILYGYIEYADILDEYKKELQNKELLEKDFSIIAEKNKIYISIQNEIKELNNSIDEVTNQINTIKSENISNSNNIKANEVVLNKLEQLIVLYDKRNDLLNEKNTLRNSYNNIKSSMESIKEILKYINDFDGNILNINNQLKPLENQRDSVKHKLDMSIEYQKDLEVFKSKYNIINTLRKYANPSEQGIQLLFIELYFYKTISMANELLQYVFDGKYQLCKPNIEGSTFDIPVIGNLLRCDDISSLSESQRSMVGLILSTTLLFQSSTEWNILKLDEVDESLDTINRLGFGTLLNTIKEKMNIEQVFYISHNEEIDLSSCDIICLSNDNFITDRIKNSNVIYSI